MKHLLFIAFILLQVSCKQTSSTPKEIEQAKNTANKKSKLINALKYHADDSPIISVHRGGKSIKNYPENCLETLKYINDSISAIYEIDVARTKDNVLVLLHDKSLERTTTGSGLLSDFNYTDLSNIRLEDDFGSVTAFSIPLLEDILLWATTHNVVLTLDIKRGVNLLDVIKLIRTHNAEDVSILITYDLKQALHAYKLAPELLLSVSARNDEELDWLLHSKIPIENMLAFTGTRLSSEAFYQKVHEYGIKTILGTLGNLDKQAAAKSDDLYMKWAAKGIDVIATDRPFEAAIALQITN